MDYTLYVMYVISVLSTAVIFFTRNVTFPELKRRFFAKKGSVWVRLYGPDRMESEDFINVLKEPLTIGQRSFVVRLEKATYKPRKGGSDKEELQKVLSGVASDLVVLEAKDGIHPKTLVLDPRRTTSKGRFPVFSFRYDQAEPFDPLAMEFDREVSIETKCQKCEKHITVVADVPSEKRMDPSVFDSMIKRAVLRSQIKSNLLENRKLLMILMGAAALAAAAAYFSYETNTTIEALKQSGALVA